MKEKRYFCDIVVDESTGKQTEKFIKIQLILIVLFTTISFIIFNYFLNSKEVTIINFCYGFILGVALGYVPTQVVGLIGYYISKERKNKKLS